jgi:RNA polymerase sigma-70 factor (ECF subfamily)
VYRFACWVLQDAATAEDVTQECFLALVEHPGRFDPSRGSLRTFLLAVARNQCRKTFRQLLPEVPLDGGEADRNVKPLDRLAASEYHAILDAAVSKLPALQREALFLFEYEGLSLEQAAMVAGTDVGTLKSRLYRGRQRLKRDLAWLVKEGL